MGREAELNRGCFSSHPAVDGALARHQELSSEELRNCSLALLSSLAFLQEEFVLIKILYLLLKVSSYVKGMS